MWQGQAGASGTGTSPTIPEPTLPPPDFGPPPDVPSLADRAASLNWDPVAIFRFVADEVRYEPYAGALRGATGTLWGQAGNSADKALLLAALLAEAAVPYRFAVGELDPAAIESLAGVPRPDATQHRARMAKILLPEAVADAWDLDGPWTRSPDVDTLMVEARERALANAATVTELLDSAGIAIADEAVDGLPARERTQHVWVQYADGPDWIDLDPTVAGAEPGVALTTASETPADLPDDLFHTVTFRVAAEVVTGGVPTRTELLTHTVRSTDVAGVGTVLIHPPADWLGVGSAITGSQQFRPTLIVGETVVEGTTMSLSTGDGVLGAFGDEADAEGQALAEWFEIDVAVPDQPLRQSTRVVFDRVAAEQRATGEIDVTSLAPIELVDTGEELGEVYIPLAGLTGVSVGSHALPPAFFAPTNLPEAGKVLDHITRSYFYVRDLMRLDMVDDLGAAIFADEPGVVAFTATPDESVGGAQRYSVSIDIVHVHDVAVPFAADGSAAQPLMRSGTIDHAVERLLLEGSLTLLPEPPEAAIASVDRLFEEAAAQGIDLVALQPGGGADPPDIGVAAGALVQAALDAGRVVVLPARPVDLDGTPRIGWWEVDPTSGRTIDRLDTGGSVDLLEYALLIQSRVEQMACFIGLGACVGIAIAGAAGWVDGAANKIVLASPFLLSVCAGGFFHGH
jgi:hypothetical protein